MNENSKKELSTPPSERRKYYNCSKCRYKTDRKNNLKRHMTTMHEQCSKLLECCNMVFFNKSTLKEHVNDCHSRAGYSCHVCNRSFSRKALMKRHSIVHNGRRQFNCHGCDYATSHKSNLDRHLKRHKQFSQDTAKWFGHVSTPRNKLPPLYDLCCQENEINFKEVGFGTLIQNGILGKMHPFQDTAMPCFYPQVMLSNYEYLKTFDSSIISQAHNSAGEKHTNPSNVDYFHKFPYDFCHNLHARYPSWRWNSSCFCQQSFSSLNRFTDIQQQHHYFIAWIRMMQTLSLKQLEWREVLESWHKKLSFIHYPLMATVKNDLDLRIHASFDSKARLIDNDELSDEPSGSDSLSASENNDTKDIKEFEITEGLQNYENEILV